MKQIPAVLFAALAFAAPALAQAPDKMALDKALMANEHAIIDAVVKKDLKTFKMMTTPDAIGVDGTGMATMADLEKVIADQKIEASSLSDMHVHWVSPDAAIVMSKWAGKGTYMGMPMPSPTWSSTLWVRKGTTWLAAFHQESTVVAMPPMDHMKKK